MMKTKQIRRRDFLKTFGSFLMGGLLLPLGRTLGIINNAPKNTLTPKEAKYYKSGDDLAG